MKLKTTIDKMIVYAKETNNESVIPFLIRYEKKQADAANVEALREEYKTADEQRKREIKAMADSIKKDAIFANDVIDNLI